MSPPESQNILTCYQLREECRKERAVQHGAVMDRLGEVLDAVATIKGREQGRQDALAEVRSTGAREAVAKGPKPWYHSISMKILEWVIFTAIAGGLFAFYEHTRKTSNPPPGPTPGAKP